MLGQGRSAPITIGAQSSCLCLIWVAKLDLKLVTLGTPTALYTEVEVTVLRTTVVPTSRLNWKVTLASVAVKIFSVGYQITSGVASSLASICRSVEFDFVTFKTVQVFNMDGWLSHDRNNDWNLRLDFIYDQRVKVLHAGFETWINMDVWMVRLKNGNRMNDSRSWPRIDSRVRSWVRSWVRSRMRSYYRHLAQ